MVKRCFSSSLHSIMFSKFPKLGQHILFLVCFQVFLCFATVVKADWNSGVTIEDISTRIAIDVVDKGVKVSVNLNQTAVAQLYAVQPEETRVSLDLNQFALNLIQIQSEQNLVPAIKSAATAEMKKSAAFITVFYPFSNEQPNQLVIAPDFQTIATAGKQYSITVSHQGLPVIDHGVLTSTETLILDWQDPWYSHFNNPKLKRDHNDPVMAFLYIEPQQIKSEVVVRIKEMANWADLKLRDPLLIYPDEFASLKQKVADFLLSKNQLITGSTSTPVLDRVDYIKMGASDIQAYTPQQIQKQVSTLIGVSIIHPTAKIPNTIQWHWELFSDKIQRVAIRAYDPAGLFDSYVTAKYPVFEWENMLADIDLPELDNKKVTSVKVDTSQADIQLYAILGILGFILLFIISYKYTPSLIRKYTHSVILLFSLAITYQLLQTGNISFKQKKLTSQQSETILNQLLWNVYQAFEATEEIATYDKLAYSISGDLIETLYLQNRKSFLTEDGGWAKTENIKIQNIKQLSADFDGSYLFDCEWLVSGQVIHWGHQHRRDNVYHATVKIMPIEDNWKITALESIGQQRVD